MFFIFGEVCSKKVDWKSLQSRKNCRITIFDWLTDLLISVHIYFTCQEDIIDGTNIIQHDEGW